MSERFELSREEGGERFTMLSGIAHDPIQRDSKCISWIVVVDWRRIGKIVT